MAMKRAATLEELLSGLPEPQKSMIEKVRKQVASAAPGAEQVLAYGNLVGFMYLGHPLIYLGAAKAHCSLYGALSDEEIRKGGELAESLKSFKISKGTIQFTPDNMIPASLVKKIVKARMKASRERWGK